MRLSFCSILILCLLLVLCGCSTPGTAPKGVQGNEPEIPDQGTVTGTLAALHDENRSGAVPYESASSMDSSGITDDSTGAGSAVTAPPGTTVTSGTASGPSFTAVPTSPSTIVSPSVNATTGGAAPPLSPVQVTIIIPSPPALSGTPPLTPGISTTPVSPSTVTSQVPTPLPASPSYPTPSITTFIPQTSPGTTIRTPVSPTPVPT